MKFWSQNTEIKFFREALKDFVSPEELFYQLKNGYFAYAPKGESTQGSTLQGRNALVGHYTEKWSQAFLQPIATYLGLHVVNSVVCKELGLTESTSADIAFCTTAAKHQSADHIKLIVEVKMSIVNNYRFDPLNGQVEFLGNYQTHKGSPSILRSDSMLKAIGKSINIRVSGIGAAKIPIIVLSNSPITPNYQDKVDFLKQAGIIQGFISVYPGPSKDCIKETSKKGFQTFEDYSRLQVFLNDLISSNMHFFASMLSKTKLGHIIAIAGEQSTEAAKAEKFLQLLNEEKI